MIILNKIQCNICKDVLISRYGWDFNCCSCHLKDASSGCCVDGGLNYLRRLGDNYTELSVIDSDSFELIRKSLARVTKGIMGNEPDRYILLKDMSNNHIANVIEYYGSNSDNPYLKYYKKELEYREENKINIHDD